MSRLTDAIVMATLAHGDAVDKAGLPYILHPLAVMLDHSLTTEDERIVAVLHDTIEDTTITSEEIEAKFGSDILRGVESVSRGYIHLETGKMIFKEPCAYIPGHSFDQSPEYTKEHYVDFVTRSAQHPIGRKVKKADIFHNMSPTRMNQLPPEMRGISKRYKKGLLQLGVSEEEIALFLEGK